MSLLQLERLAKAYGSWALAPTNLHLDPGERLAVLGESGSGKTTLLRLIAGLEAPDCGRVILQEQDITDLPTHKRHLGFMFQDYALFPHMNVADNVAFGLQVRGVPRRERTARVRHLLELMGLEGMERRRIQELSGGEKQRVALARCLAPRPRILLLDEPLAALDQGLRRRLVGELADILHKAQVPTMVVTHDPAEACRLASHVAILHQGKLLCHDPTTQLFDSPGTRETARILGLETIVEGTPLAQRLEEVLGPALAYLIFPDAALGDQGLRVQARFAGWRPNSGHTLVEVDGSTLALFLRRNLDETQPVMLHLDPQRIRTLQRLNVPTPDAPQQE
jgi:thiamine transport system ATP-binding protein